jgi:hypothetical protein
LFLHIHFALHPLFAAARRLSRSVTPGIIYSDVISFCQPFPTPTVSIGSAWLEGGNLTRNHHNG